MAERHKRRDIGTAYLYARKLLREFRGTLGSLVGAILVGALLYKITPQTALGVVRFALLMVSRRRGEKEWMLVKASTYRNHVVLCGLGHLGYRVLMQLVGQG